jgi:ComF family protein
MNQAVGTLAKNILNLLYPLCCASCGRALDVGAGAEVCSHCLKSIRPNPKPYCIRCGRPVQRAGETCTDCRRALPRFARAYSACLYEGTIRELVHSFKYKNRPSLGGVLSDLMWGFIEDNKDILYGVDALTSVPLAAGRRRSRGFNQASLLAEKISARAAIPFGEMLLKIRRTSHQNELPRERRLTNLTGAFRVRPGVRLAGLRILLVDDVMTTGATLDECAAVLMASGTKDVVCLTLARGA